MEVVYDRRIRSRIIRRRRRNGGRLKHEKSTKDDKSNNAKNCKQSKNAKRPKGLLEKKTGSNEVKKETKSYDNKVQKRQATL